MKLYKFKLFSNLYSQYLVIEGQDTWYSEIDVAKAFTQVQSQEYVEVHKIYLTTICNLE